MMFKDTDLLEFSNVSKTVNTLIFVTYFASECTSCLISSEALCICLQTSLLSYHLVDNE